jgi:ATP-binding cassette subfamily B protein
MTAAKARHRDDFAPFEAARVDVRKAPATLRRIAVLGLEHPWRLTFAALAIIAANVFALWVPKLLGAAVDHAGALLAHGPAHADAARTALFQTGLLILVAGLMRGLLTALFGYQSEYVSQSVAVKLRLAYFAQLQRLSFDYHDRVHSGDLITRGMLDLEGARMFIDMGLLRLLSVVTLVPLAVAFMLEADVKMGLLALSFTPLVAIRAGRSGYLLRQSWLRLQELMSVLTRTMEENLQGIRVVRAFAAKVFELSKFDVAAREALRLQNRRITLWMNAMSSMTLAYYVSMGLVLWFGGQEVASGQMKVGRLTEFLVYMTVLLGPLRIVGMVMNSWARAASCGGRLFEILDMEPRIRDAADARPLDLKQGVLRFDHVDFAYEDGKPVLHDVSFEVRPGRTLGIVGPPGSGKSTIAHLIPRFYDVSGGAITIDGQDVRAVTLDSLRRGVGVVQQEAFLFDTSVTNNVAYADPWAEDERIFEAANTAHIHDYVASLPEGYEARLGERGVSLSGGQRQRMSIARGVVPGPGIMVFDDATAAIDAATEQRVRHALKGATRSKATIIIAHRLGSLMHADEIIVLADGRIVERGRHEDLIKAGGPYADLYRLQTREGREAAGAEVPA